MLHLLLNLLLWTRAEGLCSGTLVSISGHRWLLSPGQSFSINCEFTCLGAHHIAQLWRNRGFEDEVCLSNMTSSLPNVSLVLSIGSAARADAGHYSCMTQPPDTISPAVLVQVADNLTTMSPTLTITSSSTQQLSHTAGLHWQMWFWMLLGKCAFLLLSAASLAKKHKSG